MPMSKENEPSIAELYQELELFIKDLIEAEKPFLERRTILRNHCRDMQLYVPDGDLFRKESWYSFKYKIYWYNKI